MTKEIAERLAQFDPDYVAKCIRGKWTVWSKAADHSVEFDPRDVAKAQDAS